GREHLNFSTWNPAAPQRAAKHADREVTRGDMPLSSYTWMHPEARLTAAERDELAKGLRATFGAGSGAIDE
ncbi:MAG TPA: heme-binding domain-containing protein, partial [Kofleriaceae bacterium]|nr:heme-binding domain-containing protein [Kofleriaceae bacterium]